MASFTSVSGPSQDILVDYIFSGLRRPWRPRRFARSVSQTLRFTYMALLSIPLLAPLVLRLTLSNPTVRRSAVDNIPVDQIHHSADLAKDAARSVKTYPANYFRALSSRPRQRVFDVPVQLIVNTQDKYVRAYGYDEAARWVPRLWRRDIRAGHFSPMSHPQVMAAAVSEFADLVDGKPPSRGLLRAQVGRPRGAFGDTLVLVTGAGSGIGRETAYAFAREGAEVVISDIDEARGQGHRGADHRARRGRVSLCARRLGRRCGRGIRRAGQRRTRRADIVVNNAGIGQAGRFLDTPREQFDRVLDVNLGGVVNGCRSFGRRLVERGTGGHIVNVSSMAAYAPLQSLNAYCTSKAATFMFSDCLRAELDAAGVGPTAIARVSSTPTSSAPPASTRRRARAPVKSRAGGAAREDVRVAQLRAG